MMRLACAAGVDVGRDWLDVAQATSGRPFREPNAPKGIEAIVGRLKRAGVVRVVLESIGAYGQPLVRALGGAGFEVAVVDPRRVKALRLAEGRRAKTDRLDAGLIARFALLMSDVVRPAPSAQALEIRALSTRRRQVVELCAVEKTRLKQAIDADVAASCRRLIALLEEERAQVEARLDAALFAVPGNREKAALLQTIPGVGPAVSSTLLADMPELGTLDRKAVASLAGLAPHPDDSGTRTGRGRIGGGRACVRVAMYMAALGASRSEAGLKREYQALRDAGKPPKVALVAIARRLLIAANSIIRSGEPWKPT